MKPLRILLIPLGLVLLAGCATPPRPGSASPGSVGPARQGTAAGEVHGTVGMGVSSERGAIGKADLTLSICNNPTPFSVGVRTSDGRNGVTARC